jgi:hypothetical protein
MQVVDATRRSYDDEDDHKNPVTPLMVSLVLRDLVLGLLVSQTAAAQKTTLDSLRRAEDPRAVVRGQQAPSQVSRQIGS